MSSKIEWTDETWNPVTGCEKVSPGCANCYASTWAARNMGEWRGRAFNDVRSYPARLSIPRDYKKPTRFFVNSMSDLFHKDVSDEFVARVWMEMLTYRRHTFQVLTKRPERMRRIVKRIYENGFPFIQFVGEEPRMTAEQSAVYNAPNIWLGVSIESNEYAWRADMLRETPAAVRFLSIEPMLGPVDKVDLAGIDWVIVGGESGHRARPIHPKWIKDVRDRCGVAGIPFFFKQWGEWKPICEIDEDASPNLLYHPAPKHDPERVRKARYKNIVHHFDGSVHDPIALGSWLQGRGAMLTFRLGKARAGRELDGRTWDEFPAVRT